MTDAITPASQTPSSPARARWLAGAVVAAILGAPGGGRADIPTAASETVTGQIAARGAESFVSFVDRAVRVEWSGRDSLPMPQGQQAISRLTRHLPFEQLVTAGESAFAGAGYDRLVVTGVDIADRALRLAGRPTGLRLQGSTRMIRGASPTGGYTGQGTALGVSSARSIGQDVVAGLTFGTERDLVESRDRSSALLNRGVTAAAELGWRMAPDTTLHAAVGTSLLGRDITSHGGAVTAVTGAHREFVSLRSEFAMEANGFRLSPSSTLQFTTEVQDPYTDSAGVHFSDRIQHYGRLTASVEVGYAFDLSRGEIDVYANVQGDWDFIHPDRVTLTTGRWDHDLAARAGAAGGVALTSQTGFASGLEVRNDAIGPDGLNATTLSGSIRFSF